MTKEEFRDYIKFKLLDVDFDISIYIAVDEDGEVWGFRSRPLTLMYAWENTDDFYTYLMDIRNLDELGINWKDTLVKL